MRTKLLLSTFFLFLSVISFAQKPSGRSGGNMERIKAMKVGLITEKLQLTEEQAKTFWPTYNKFEGEKRQLSRTLREKMKLNAERELTEKEEIKRQDEVFALKAKEVDLAKKYRPEFLQSISAKQYSDLVLAEREFNQMLLRELHERRRERKD
ncbi:hypothetical protein [Arcticibacterium luteifluviistationis]|nr:hypothetical protein [Arcticibacterium luteifluviistationis]